MRDKIGQMYKLIIMDVEMPYISGWETTEKLVQMHKQSKISTLPTIIAHTAYTDE